MRGRRGVLGDRAASARSDAARVRKRSFAVAWAGVSPGVDDTRGAARRNSSPKPERAETASRPFLVGMVG